MDESGHPQYGPNPVPNTGAVIQPANSFSTSTPVIEFGNSADASAVPQGQRLRNMAINCLPPSGTYISGSIGILDDYGEENAGGDGLFIDSCKIAIDIEGANAINSGPWNNTIVHFDAVTESGALCVRYGTTASSGTSGPNRGFHGISCDGESATTEIATGFQLDDSNIALDGLNIEAITTGIEVGANHSVYGVTIGNVHCIGTSSPSYPMTTCVDLSSANTASATLTNINAPSSFVTNVVKDNNANGATILQSVQQSVSFYVRDFKNNQSLTTASTFNGVCATLDQTCLTVDEEFFNTSANVTGTTGVQVPFSYPWIFLFNCTTSGGQTWGDSNGNAVFPNLGQGRLVGCTTAASGDQILAGMAYGTTGIAGFGALGSNANWEARWGATIDGTTSETFRIGFLPSRQRGQQHLPGIEHQQHRGALRHQPVRHWISWRGVRWLGLRGHCEHAVQREYQLQHLSHSLHGVGNDSFQLQQRHGIRGEHARALSDAFAGSVARDAERDAAHHQDGLLQIPRVGIEPLAMRKRKHRNGRARLAGRRSGQTRCATSPMRCLHDAIRLRWVPTC